MVSNNEEIYTNIRQNIKKIREEKKISQETLARKIGLKTRQSMSAFENGHTEISLSQFIKICIALNCSADELLADQLSALKIGSDCPYYKKLSEVNRSHVDAISTALYNQDKEKDAEKERKKFNREFYNRY